MPILEIADVGVHPIRNECMIGLRVKDPSKFWMLRFDRSKSKQGARAGFELIIPMGKTYFTAHRLHFYCTNNIVEYEALVHGLLMALRNKVKMLQVFGDSELVLKQVKKLFFYHDRRLENYRHRVWDLLEILDAFNI